MVKVTCFYVKAEFRLASASPDCCRLLLAAPGNLLGSPGCSWHVLGAPGTSQALLASTARSWHVLGAAGTPRAAPSPGCCRLLLADLGELLAASGSLWLCHWHFPVVVTPWQLLSARQLPSIEMGALRRQPRCLSQCLSLWRDLLADPIEMGALRRHPPCLSQFLPTIE